MTITVTREGLRKRFFVALEDGKERDEAFWRYVDDQIQSLMTSFTGSVPDLWEQVRRTIRTNGLVEYRP